MPANESKVRCVSINVQKVKSNNILGCSKVCKRQTEVKNKPAKKTEAAGASARCSLLLRPALAVLIWPQNIRITKVSENMTKNYKENGS